MRMIMLASAGLLSWSPAWYSCPPDRALVSRNSTLRFGSRACFANHAQSIHDALYRKANDSLWLMSQDVVK